MSKKIVISMVGVIAAILCIITFLVVSDDKTELKTVKSDKELLSLVGKENYSESKEILTNIFGMPFSILTNNFYIPTYDSVSINSSKSNNSTGIGYNPEYFSGVGTNAVVDEESSSSNASSSSSKDYSTTNIQVENVDEADITKTDGDYIYSLSEDNVIITNVKNPEDIKIEATINPQDGSIPEDLILYNNKLVVISETSGSNSYYSSYKSNTIVNVYNIEDKSKPRVLKSYELHEPYYTSRCIGNELYIISSGYAREENNKIDRKYTEDNQEKEINFNNIKYLKDLKTKKQTIIAVADLDNIQNDIDVSSYLIDISNAYVSENSIYLLDEKYEYGASNNLSIKKLFGIKGVFGLFDYDSIDYNSSLKTEIYKFNISKDGKVTYSAKTKTEGRTINQYSLDEKEGHLRIALYDNDGARIAVFDENLNQIGVSNNLAKGEKMYSSRFIGDKAYLVTYRTIDPLFVIDLSNESNPKVLGQLKIPGYSTYLHPYDENHIIGIGMETKETVNKNSSGKVTSTSARIVGMKMALFDVSDVNNPTQISQTVIGDSRTTSAILTNPKALLFSKEKELIAIPVNNYAEDFEITSNAESYESVVNSYRNYSKPHIAEGYFVYKINLDDGFKLKGVITHETNNKNQKSYYSYYSKSKLLRGLYIDNNLYTVSESAVKVNNLESLDQICELKINKGE